MTLVRKARGQTQRADGLATFLEALGDPSHPKLALMLTKGPACHATDKPPEPRSIHPQRGCDRGERTLRSKRATEQVQRPSRQVVHIVRLRGWFLEQRRNELEAQPFRGELARPPRLAQTPPQPGRQGTKLRRITRHCDPPRRTQRAVKIADVPVNLDAQGPGTSGAEVVAVLDTRPLDERLTGSESHGASVHYLLVAPRNREMDAREGVSVRSQSRSVPVLRI